MNGENALSIDANTFQNPNYVFLVASCRKTTAVQTSYLKNDHTLHTVSQPCYQGSCAQRHSYTNTRKHVIVSLLLAIDQWWLSDCVIEQRQELQVLNEQHRQLPLLAYQATLQRLICCDTNSNVPGLRQPAGKTTIMKSSIQKKPKTPDLLCCLSSCLKFSAFQREHIQLLPPAKIEQVVLAFS